MNPLKYRLTDSNILKIYNYLNRWRFYYFNNDGDWDNFLCGFVKNSRSNRNKLLHHVESKLGSKTNTDVAKSIMNYIKDEKTDNVRQYNAGYKSIKYKKPKSNKTKKTHKIINNFKN